MIRAVALRKVLRVACRDRIGDHISRRVHRSSTCRRLDGGEAPRIESPTSGLLARDETVIGKRSHFGSRIMA